MAGFQGGEGGLCGIREQVRFAYRFEKNSKTYTVKSGDSLSKIAKLELGRSSKWNEIYKLNAKIIGSDPNRITPGQKLVMP